MSAGLARSSEHVVDGLDRAFVANVGNRCTLVCAASLIRLAGTEMDGIAIAIQIGELTGFDERRGPPNRAYLAWPGSRPSLDTAIETVARRNGVRVRSRTRLFPPPSAVARAILARRPVILNVLRAPSGAWSHSVIAYGCRARPGFGTEILIADPNDPTGKGGWARLYLPWEVNAVTATFITSV